MASFTLYRQQRQDGGLRTGLEIDGGETLQSYHASQDEHDPGLVWYIDLRGTCDSLPDDANAVRAWMQQHAEDFKAGLTELAERFRAGIDVDEWPFQVTFDRQPEGATVTLAISTVRRLDAREIGGHLAELASEWDTLLAELDPLAEAT
jgi:hypothetical protein